MKVTLNEHEQPIYFIGVALPEPMDAQVSKLMLPFAVQAAQLRREFSPHVTLAQIKHPQTLDRSRTVGTIEQAISLPIRFEVTSLTCFRRILPRTYQPEGI